MKKIFAVITVFILAGCTKPAKPAKPAEPAEPAEANKPAETGATAAAYNAGLSGEITISCYDDNSYILNRAIEVFNVKYPNIKVKVDRFAPDQIVREIENEDGSITTMTTQVDDDQAEKDYIKRVNTELMSGGGADILQIDVIPWYRYAEMGYLTDLQAFMDKDPGFNEADYRMNVLDAVKHKGGQYVMPLTFATYFFAYDTSLFNEAQTKALEAKDAFTFGELIDIAKDAFNGDNYIFGLTDGYQGSSIFNNHLMRENYASFVDIVNKKAYFNDGRFEEMLLTITDYAEKGYIKNARELTDWTGSGRNPNPDERFFYKYEYDLSLMQNFDRQLNITGNPMYDETYGNDKDDAIAGMAADYNGDIPFDAFYMYGINENSKNKDAA